MAQKGSASLASNGQSAEIVDIAEPNASQDSTVRDGEGGWKHGRKLTEDYALQSHG
jgi:hypothetical protein